MLRNNKLLERLVFRAPSDHALSHVIRTRDRLYIRDLAFLLKFAAKESSNVGCSSVQLMSVDRLRTLGPATKKSASREPHFACSQLDRATSYPLFESMVVTPRWRRSPERPR